MATIFCRECHKLQKIVDWKRDNPVLECGHVKARELVDDLLDDIGVRFREAIKNYCRETDLNVQKGLPENEAKISAKNSTLRKLDEHTI